MKAKLITTARAVRRYLQILAIEQTVEKLEAAIEDVVKEIDDAEDRLKNLRKQKAELLNTMRDSANDEGQLPLFDDLQSQLADLGIPSELLPPPLTDVFTDDAVTGEARH